MPSNKIALLNESLERGSLMQARRLLNTTIHPGDIAHLLESSPPRDRRVIWQLIDKNKQPEVLQELNEDVREELIEGMSVKELVNSLANMDVDDTVDILQQLPNRVINDVLGRMDEENRNLIQDALSYPQDSAGGLMNTDFVTIRDNVTVEVVLRFLRRIDLPKDTDAIYVIDSNSRLIGIVLLTSLVNSMPTTVVQQIMSNKFTFTTPDVDEGDIAHIFTNQGLVSLPVINENHVIIGRITIDDVLDLVRELGESSIVAAAPVFDDDDTFAPIRKTVVGRTAWLGINLVTAIAAAMTISLFENVISNFVALAILMPVVASMGGIAGSQTMTIIVRGLALGQVTKSNVKYLISREFIIGGINGIIWSIIIGLVAGFWFDQVTLGFIIAIAIIVNLFVASLCGVLLPLLLKSLGIDPALAGNVILTTVTDVVGFFSFLGLATLIYL